MIDLAAGTGRISVRCAAALGRVFRHIMVLFITGHVGELILSKQKSWWDGSVTHIVTDSLEEILL